MGVSNSWSSLLNLNKHIICFFYLLISCATSLNFSIANIGPENGKIDIITEGNGAYISNQGIHLTSHKLRAGRATYIRPLHLWDNASGQLVDFSTNFSFAIESKGATDYGDGLAFFIAENNSVITEGGFLGLPINETGESIRFIAVEFDTFWNNWDPGYLKNSSLGDHVGININSIQSVSTRKWFSGIPSGKGKENKASIHYNSTSRNLSVVFTDFVNDVRVIRYGFHWTVDLRITLPEWVIFGFTASTGDSFQKTMVRSWSFNSSNLNDVEGRGPIAPTPGETKAGNSSSKTSVVVGLTVGLSFLVGGLASHFVVCLWIRKKEEKRKDLVKMDEEFQKRSGPKKFSYSDLAVATNNFADDRKLGVGSFGGVYKGFLVESGSYVAVKKVSRNSKQGINEYASEVKIISQLRHRNLVQLIGWCHEKNEMLLVYEFLKHGSLDSHLFSEKSLLTWERRYRIAQGLASALLYLHEEWEQCILHRDVKSSNVMLDSNFNPKLGDFGLAKLVEHEKESPTPCSVGTLGYMAPECCLKGKTSKGSDVFSFGIVALEIACGRKSIKREAEEGQIRLVDWVWQLYGTGKLVEAADPKLADFDERQMECLMTVGLWCAHPDVNLRPTIKQAIQALSFEAPPPSLPLRDPDAAYLDSPLWPYC